MEAREIVGQMLDRIEVQARRIESENALRNQIHETQRQADRATARADRSDRDKKEMRDQIKTFEIAFNAWREKSPGLKVPPAVRSALDALTTDDIPF